VAAYIRSLLMSVCCTVSAVDCDRLIILYEPLFLWNCLICDRGQLKCDGTCTETRFRLLAKWTSPFKPAGGRQLYVNHI